MVVYLHDGSEEARWLVEGWQPAESGGHAGGGGPGGQVSPPRRQLPAPRAKGLYRGTS